MSTPAQAATAAEFDSSLVAHLMRVPRRSLLRVAEVAELLGVEKKQVYELLTAGDLEGHEMTPTRPRRRKGLFGEVLTDGGKLAERERRRCTRVTRRSVVFFLASSASYDLSAEDHVAVIAQVLRDLPTRALEVIRAECSKTLAVRNSHSQARDSL